MSAPGAGCELVPFVFLRAQLAQCPGHLAQAGLLTRVDCAKGVVPMPDLDHEAHVVVLLAPCRVQGTIESLDVIAARATFRRPDRLGDGRELSPERAAAPATRQDAALAR